MLVPIFAEILGASIAGIPIRVENRYDYTAKIAKDYITNDVPLLSVHATDEQICEENRYIPGLPIGYVESVVIYRNIAESIYLHDAFVFHGATVAVGDKAYIIAAKSGVGKTTHIGFWLKKYKDKCYVLNGDKPVIRMIDNKPYVSGTPWQGKEGLGTNKMLPLSGIAFLERAGVSSSEKTDKNEALIKILSQTYIPKTEAGAKKVIGLVSRINELVPTVRLMASLDESAAEVAYDALVNNKFYKI